MSANKNFNRFAEFPRTHVTISPGDETDLEREMLIYCGSDGVIAVEDQNGTIINYTVTSGAILPIVVKKVRGTDTTVTQVIGLY